MGVLLVIIGFITISVIFVLWMKKRYSIWKDMGAPYEEPDIIFGNLKGVAKDVHDGLLMQKFYKKHKAEGPFVGIFLFLKPVALITDIELVKNVLIKDFNIFHDRDFFVNEEDEPITGHLFTLSGAKWKNIRNKLTPTFTSGKMKMMFPTIVEVGKRLETKLDEMVKRGDDFDIKALMARYTVDTIGTCAFGLDCNSLADDDSEFFKVGTSIFDNPRNGTELTFLLSSFKGIAKKLGMKNFRDEVTDFYTKIVRKTVDYRIENKIQRNDFMDLLLKLYANDSDDRLTFDELTAQAFSFLVAGFETSSTTLQFCFYELAKNPDIQEKLRNHIKDVLKKHNGEVTYEAVADMKYLNQVVCETLRLYAPASNLVRCAGRDYLVPGTKFILKKGTSIMVPVFAIHRDPEYYPNPLKFNPENFSEENIEARPPLAYLPFGEGPRICIGYRFANMQVKIGLISTLQKNRLELSSKTEEPLELLSKFFIAQVKGGVWLRAKSI